MEYGAGRSRQASYRSRGRGNQRLSAVCGGWPQKHEPAIRPALPELIRKLLRFGPHLVNQLKKLAAVGHFHEWLPAARGAHHVNRGRVLDADLVAEARTFCEELLK